MNSQFAFLKSVRFWQLVIVAVVIVLKQQNIIIDNTLLDTVSQIIAIVLTGSTVIRTVDRIADKSGSTVVSTGDVANQTNVTTTKASTS